VLKKCQLYATVLNSSQEIAMNTNDKSVEEALVSCEVCLKEVPLSEATVPEAQDYFAHFCGLACYQQWKDQQAKLADNTPPAEH
jgi:hypothetical protein